MKRSILLAMAGVLSLALLAPLAARAARSKSSVPPALAPNFVLPQTDGAAWRLSDHRGQTIVLNFWAFWCDTWKAEMPYLRQLAGRQKALGFQIAAISVDGTRLAEFERGAKAVEGGEGAPFPVLLDIGKHVSGEYRVGHVPTVVIVAPDGRIVYTAVGYPGNQAILTQVRRLQAQGPATQPSRP